MNPLPHSIGRLPIVLGDPMDRAAGWPRHEERGQGPRSRPLLQGEYRQKPLFAEESPAALGRFQPRAAAADSREVMKTKLFGRALVAVGAAALIAGGGLAARAGV